MGRCCCGAGVATFAVRVLGLWSARVVGIRLENSFINELLDHKTYTQFLGGNIMAISQADLLNASRRASLHKSRAIARAGQSTAFLCHSHHDRELAEGLQTLLQEQGWDVYIDWQDATMPDVPNRTTATQIQNRIKSMAWFLYLATANSATSRWCPWEIGFADGQKASDKIVVVTTTDASGRHHGNEYLQLYQQITPSSAGSLALFGPGATTGGAYVKSLI
jgi:hypothetical protein